MKPKRLLTLLLLLAGYAVPQAQVQFRVIGAAQRIDKIMESGFYIAEIRDERNFTANLGIVNRGLDCDIKRPLIAESDFFSNLKSRMNGWLMHDAEAEPVVLHIRQLYLWEDLRRELDDGEGFIRLDLLFEAPGKPTQNITVTLSGDQLTVAKGHSPRMEDAFFHCLQRYQERWENSDFREIEEESLADAWSGRGLQTISNFLDLRQGRMNTFPGKLKRVQVIGRLERYRLRNREQSERYNFYALQEGNELFIRGNAYPGGADYYTRVLEKGRYLFLIDRVHFPMKSTFVDAGIPSGKIVGILIDMKTGMPQIVTDELIAEVLKPYPDLKKQYLFQNILDYPVQLDRVRKVIAEVNRRS
ncbi:MAG: hypothetical protein RIC19_10435 [Phaeodactylibacter sp.]|uniref:hypothetical protein n=1 Tax=Phaeodactylibacter sp. TaxID=1940289 RepID=UPI0032F09CB4